MKTEMTRDEFVAAVLADIEQLLTMPHKFDKNMFHRIEATIDHLKIIRNKVGCMLLKIVEEKPNNEPVNCADDRDPLY